jgi:hypothetical protein
VTSRDAADVEARLRSALVTADQLVARDGVDMSAEAVTHRLMELAEMSSLCLELAATARPPSRGDPRPP